MFLILGSLLSYIGTDAIRISGKIRKKGVECRGRIIAEEPDSDGTVIPVIEFTPAGGAMVRKKPFLYSGSDLSKLRSNTNKGNKDVLVLYDPDEPARFILVGSGRLNYLFFALFIVAGVAFAVTGICSIAGYLPFG